MLIALGLILYLLVGFAIGYIGVKRFRWETDEACCWIFVWPFAIAVVLIVGPFLLMERRLKLIEAERDREQLREGIAQARLESIRRQQEIIAAQELQS